MSTTSIPKIVAVPGLVKQSPEFLRELWELCRRNGWDVNAIAAIISIESGFDPRAHSTLPKQTAYGLLQWIASTQKAIGTSRAELERLGATGQLKYVEAFFRKYLPRIPTIAGDYYAVTYGRSDAIGKPDSYVLDAKNATSPASRNRYNLNAGLDFDKDGAITIGDLRTFVARRINKANGKTVDVPPTNVAAVTGDRLGLYLAALMRGAKWTA